MKEWNYIFSKQMVKLFSFKYYFVSVLKFVFFVFWKLREFQLEDPGDQSPSCPPAALLGSGAGGAVNWVFLAHRIRPRADPVCASRACAHWDVIHIPCRSPRDVLLPFLKSTFSKGSLGDIVNLTPEHSLLTLLCVWSVIVTPPQAPSYRKSSETERKRLSFSKNF